MATDARPTPPPLYLHHCWDRSQSDCDIFAAHGPMIVAAAGLKTGVHDSAPHPVLAILPSLSCPGIFVRPDLTCPSCPVLDAPSRLSCHSSPARDFLFRLSCPSCTVLLCFCRPVVSFLPWMSCHPRLSCPNCPLQLSCTNCPVLEVMF
jgi:hypothetical protein